ncbi:MAG: hypothetical protein HRT74_09470, partial [Flavobacteriales bacterium]|nr:hypothetical protein [Flavobacteriales bacterium]
MKPFLLSLFSFDIAMGLAAQELPYSFEVLTGQEYVPLDPETSQDLTNGFSWDDPDIAFGVGLQFYFMNQTTLQMNIVTWNGLGGIISSPSSVPGTLNLIVPHNGDLIDTGYPDKLGDSPILKFTEGEPGSRITKIEWKNVGFWNEY